jgi:magnesium transporter
MAQGASPLLYQILNNLVDYCYPIVKKVHQNMERIENNMFRAEPRGLLYEMAILRRDIISLRSILRPQMSVVRALITGNWSFIHEDLDPYWGDINDHLSQLCSLLEEYTEVVNGLSETIDTLASHRIDEVVRILTIVTVLTLPVTVLSTIFSMNVTLPMSSHPLLFFTIVSIGFGLTGWLVWYLRKKKWL